MAFVNLVWPLSGGVVVLEFPPGFDFNNGNGWGEMYTMDCSADGSVVVGYYWLNDVVESRAGLWTNGAFTELVFPGLPSTDPVYPWAVSDNGAIVTGAGRNGSGLARWTTRTNGAWLPPLANGTFIANWNGGRQVASADGSKVVGVNYITTESQYHNVVWTNGAPADWGNTHATSRDVGMCFISSDGSTILGYQSGNNSHTLGYWRDPNVFRCMKGAGGLAGDVAVGYFYGCNANGTRFYGEANDQYGIRRQCYWDNVSSVTGSVDFGPSVGGSGPSGVQNVYGNLHILPSAGQAGLEDFALVANVAVGNGYNDIIYAARWDESTFRNLQPDPLPTGSWFHGRGMCVSDDGTIVAGNATSSAPTSGAAYWDASHVRHILPLPPECSNSYVFGISANNAIMHGSGDLYTTVNPVSWEFIGAPKGAIGDAWTDPSYVDFANPTVRLGFLGLDNSWHTLGATGDYATGVSPMSFLTAQDSYDPYRILYGFGQDYGQSSWDFILSSGTNPATGEPYPDLYFDVCSVGVIDSELVFHVGFVDLSVADNRRRFVSSEGTPAWMERDGSLPFNTSPTVYLTTMGPPLEFTQNNGIGGAFAPNGSVGAAGGPGCSTYTVTEGDLGSLADPHWRLTLSDDGGRTWGRMVKPRAIGKTGRYLTRLRWLKLGQSRERLVRLESTDSVRNTIIGVYIDIDAGMD